MLSNGVNWSVGQGDQYQEQSCASFDAKLLWRVPAPGRSPQTSPQNTPIQSREPSRQRENDRMMDVKFDATSHAPFLRGLLYEHQETLKHIENTFGDFLVKHQLHSGNKGNTRFQDEANFQGVTQSQLAEMSASIVAQVLDKLPERLGQRTKDPFPDQLPNNSYPKGTNMLHPSVTTSMYSSGNGMTTGDIYLGAHLGPAKEHPEKILFPDGDIAEEEKDDGEVAIDVTTIANIKVLDRMHMAEDHENLPSIELEEDSSLTGIFANDTDVCKPVHKVEEYYWTTGIYQSIARSNHFANLTIIVVVLNSIYLAVDSDWNNASNIYDAELLFKICTQFFCVYFTLELLIRFFAFRHKEDCLRDGWFKFDLFLVATMILDVWMIMVFLKLYQGSGNVRIPTQPLRMLRLFKLTRMARLMKAFPELMTMIKGLFRSLRATVASMGLLMVLVYTTSILLHLMLKDMKQYNQDLQADVGYSFSSIGNCMWTLLTAGTLMLDNASPLMHNLIFNHNHKPELVISGILFITFTGISALVILQMLIGVLCDVVSQINESRRDALAIGLVKQELVGYLRQMDKEHDGMLTKSEIGTMLCSEKSSALLKRLNINGAFFEKMSDLAFRDEDHQVPLRTILELLLMCRGDNPVNVNILASTMCVLINCVGDITSNMNSMQYQTSVVRRSSHRSSPKSES